jgi:hypothetical protein
MKREYENLSTHKLREMLLNGSLKADSMGMEDYERLLNAESDYDEPNCDVISFCANGLDQFDKYRIDIQPPTLEQVQQKYSRQTQQKRNRVISKVARWAAVFVVGVSIAALLAQGVSVALGYNLYGTIRDWFSDNNDTVGILISEPDDELGVDLREIRTTTPNTDSTDEPTADEFVFIDFDSIEDIDDEWLARVSPRLFERFEFLSADYMSFQGGVTFNIHFVEENSNAVTLTIRKLPMAYVEREGELFIEELTVNRITFEIFRNMEDYQVIWEHEGLFYNFGAFLTIEEVRELITNWY